MEWQRTIRSLVKIGAYVVGLGALAFGAPLFLGLAVGVVGSRLGARFVDSRLEDKVSGSERPRTASSAKRMGRESVLKFHGWNVDGLPLDMTFSSVNSRQAQLGAAGIDGLITAKKPFFGTEAMFSFPVERGEVAAKLQGYIESSGVEAKVARDGAGGFIVSSGSLEVVNALAKMAYPQRSVAVARELVHVQQYMVEGAKSFEEARAMLEADRSAGRLINSYVSMQDTVNCMQGEPILNGSPVNAEFLNKEIHLGAYVVNIEEVTDMKGSMEVPADVEPKDFVSYAEVHFDSGRPDTVTDVSERFVNGTPEGLERYFIYETNGHHVQLRNPESIDTMLEDGLKAYVVFGSAEALGVALDEGRLAEGTFVSISSSRPDVGVGRYVMELDLADHRVRDLISRNSDLPASVQVELERLGVDAASVDYSLIVDRVRRDGSVGASLSGELSEDILCDGRVNGTMVSMLQERLTDERLYDLDVEKAIQWTKDASQIKFVNVEVDVVRSELRITSIVGNDGFRKTERLPLSDNDIDSLSRRGSLSKAQMKDLLIQLHPDYFKTYSTVSGESIFKEPVAAFISGTKPVLTADGRKQEKARTKALKPVRQKGPKLSV